MSTKASFKSLFKNPKYVSWRCIYNKWDKLKALGFEHYESESGSEYLVDKKTGDIYRLSDHWGNVGSCMWPHFNKDGVDITRYDDGFRLYGDEEDYSLVFNVLDDQFYFFLEVKKIRKRNQYRESDRDIAVCNIKDFFPN